MTWFGYTLDLFEFYSAALFAFVTIYYVLVFTVAGWQIARILRGADTHKRLLRTYLSYQLVTVRVAPLASELLQIALWCLILAGIWYLYWQIAFGSWAANG